MITRAVRSVFNLRIGLSRALITDGPVFALVKGHDRVSGTHKVR